MGWIQRLTGSDRLREAGRDRMRAARIGLNGPDYNQVTGMARDNWSAVGERWANENNASLNSAYGRIGGTFSAAQGRMDNLYGDARGSLDENFNAQIGDINQSAMLNSRALASYGAQALGSVSGPGGSLQARFAGAMDAQNNIGQQMNQNMAQATGMRADARGNYMSLNSGLYSDQANMTGQLAGQQAGLEAGLAESFAGLNMQGRMQAGQLGFEQGQADYGNQMQEALLQRQIEQEPYLTNAQNNMARAQHRQGLMQMGIGLASALPGLGGALSSLGFGLYGAAGNAGQGVMQSITGGIQGMLPGGSDGSFNRLLGGANFYDAGQSLLGGWNGFNNMLMNGGQQSQANQQWAAQMQQQLMQLGQPPQQQQGQYPGWAPQWNNGLNYQLGNMFPGQGGGN